MQKTFGPIVVHRDKPQSFETKCYGSGFDCVFRIGDTCTHADPHKKLEDLPNTPDWCEMKASAIWDAKMASRKQA